MSNKITWSWNSHTKNTAKCKIRTYNIKFIMLNSLPYAITLLFITFHIKISTFKSFYYDIVLSILLALFILNISIFIFGKISICSNYCVFCITNFLYIFVLLLLLIILPVSNYSFFLCVYFIYHFHIFLIKIIYIRI